MLLMTEELETRLLRYPLYSQDGKGFDAQCIAHFYNPLGRGDWFITEGEKEGDDWLLFGYADLGLGPENSEFGYISLKELESLDLPFGLSIECSLDTGLLRDMLDDRGIEFNDFKCAADDQ